MEVTDATAGAGATGIPGILAEGFEETRHSRLCGLCQHKAWRSPESTWSRGLSQGRLSPRRRSEQQGLEEGRPRPA